MAYVFKFYESKPPTKFSYEDNSFKNMSLKEYLKSKAMFGISDFFGILEGGCLDYHLLESEKYKKAKSKWRSFCRNNIFFSDEFIKEGDTVEFMDYDLQITGTVIEKPKCIDDTIIIKMNESGYIRRFSPYIKGIKINGVKKEPKFYIKRRKKIYGLNKEQNILHI